jgi:segregation and condensation protein B
MLYGTTREFLEYFGLKDLSELPTLKDFKEVAESLPEPDLAPEPAQEPVGDTVR